MLIFKNQVILCKCSNPKFNLSTRATRVSSSRATLPITRTPCAIVEEVAERQAIDLIAGSDASPQTTTTTTTWRCSISRPPPAAPAPSAHSVHIMRSLRLAGVGHARGVGPIRRRKFLCF